MKSAPGRRSSGWRVAWAGLALLSGGAAIAAPAASQGRWKIEPSESIAWWQVDPHLNHLWATTCPQEPSWRPGDDKSSGFGGGGGGFRSPGVGYSNIADTVPMPRYPRLEATPICPEAVTGEVSVADTTRWVGVRGVIDVKSSALVTTNHLHDAFAHRAILETARHPRMRFTIDSVVQVTAGDTLTGTVVGTLEMLGGERVMRGPVQAWREAGGLRVTGRLQMPAADLTDVWGVSRYSLGLGISTGIWRSLYFGIDVLLRPAAERRAGNGQ